MWTARQMLCVSPRATRLVAVLFFFNNTSTTEIYTLSLHDALPILRAQHRQGSGLLRLGRSAPGRGQDRKSTRLNSSHVSISYAVFCLKKKNNLPKIASHNAIHGQ